MAKSDELAETVADHILEASRLTAGAGVFGMFGVTVVPRDIIKQALLDLIDARINERMSELLDTIDRLPPVR